MKSIQKEDTRTYAEKRNAIRMKEKLVEIVCDAMEDGCVGLCNHPPCFQVERLVNALIANGVTVGFKKPPVNLAGKCGSCAFAKDECPSVYVRCTNTEHIAKYFRSKDKSLRQRTTPACKQYKQKEGACNA